MPRKRSIEAAVCALVSLPWRLLYLVGIGQGVSVIVELKSERLNSDLFVESFSLSSEELEGPSSYGRPCSLLCSGRLENDPCAAIVVNDDEQPHPCRCGTVDYGLAVVDEASFLTVLVDSRCKVDYREYTLLVVQR